MNNALMECFLVNKQRDSKLDFRQVQNQKILKDLSQNLNAHNKKIQDEWSKIYTTIIKTNTSYDVEELSRFINSFIVKKQVDEGFDEIQIDENIDDAEKILQLFNEGNYSAIQGMDKINGEMILKALTRLKESNQINQTCLEIIEAPDIELTLESAGKDTYSNIESVAELSVNVNELNFSGLLNKPSTVDDWFEVIDIITSEYFNKYNKTMPSKAQVWSQLYSSPPIGYGITVHDDNSVKMVGITHPFSKRSFDRRWKKYTDKLDPYNKIKPN
jgi:hypothetical protein